MPRKGWSPERGSPSTTDSNFAQKIRGRVGRIAGELGVISASKQNEVIRRLQEVNPDADSIRDEEIKDAFRRK